MTPGWIYRYLNVLYVFMLKFYFLVQSIQIMSLGNLIIFTDRLLYYIQELRYTWSYMQLYRQPNIRLKLSALRVKTTALPIQLVLAVELILDVGFLFFFFVPLSSRLHWWLWRCFLCVCSALPFSCCSHGLLHSWPPWAEPRTPWSLFPGGGGEWTLLLYTGLFFVPSNYVTYKVQAQKKNIQH